MSEETNTEWAEMDIDAYRKNSNVEKKEEPTIDKIAELSLFAALNFL